MVDFDWGQLSPELGGKHPSVSPPTNATALEEADKSTARGSRLQSDFPADYFCAKFGGFGERGMLAGIDVL